VPERLYDEGMRHLESGLIDGGLRLS
jgi:hypothetical protein